MRRFGLSLASGLFIIVLGVFLLQYLEARQSHYPFASRGELQLQLPTSTVSKEQLQKELDQLVDAHPGAQLLKVRNRQEGQKEQRDLYYFGSQPPVSRDLPLAGQRILWFGRQTIGQLRPAQALGTTPLFGTYAWAGDERFISALQTWAEERGLAVQVQERPSFWRNLRQSLLALPQSGRGQIVSITFLLWLSTVLAYFRDEHRHHVLRLLGGISPRRIVVDIIIDLSQQLLWGLLLGLLILAVGVGLFFGYQQISIAWRFSRLILLGLSIGLLLLLGLSACLLRPRVAVVSQPGFAEPWLEYSHRGLRFLSCLSFFLLLPGLLTTFWIRFQLAQEYQIWQGFENHVQVALSQEEASTQEPAKTLEFLQGMADHEGLALSYVVDQSIHLEEELGDAFDHFIVTDPQWLEAMELSVSDAQAAGQLKPLQVEQLSPGLRTFLQSQLPLWLTDKNAELDSLPFYVWTGKKPLVALPPNLAMGNQTVHAKHPLVLLVDHPTRDLEFNGFLLPALTSGNLVFKQDTYFENALARSPLYWDVLSIDTIADVALHQGQDFQKEANFYVLAIGITLFLIGYSGFLAAKNWLDQHQKVLFIERTSGHPYHQIFRPALRLELGMFSLAAFLGLGYGALFGHLPLTLLLGVGAGGLLLFITSLLLTYHGVGSQRFQNIIQRA